MYESLYKRDKNLEKITRNVSVYKSDFKLIVDFGGGFFTRGIYRMVDSFREKIVKTIENDKKKISK